jgi:putrescine importer
MSTMSVEPTRADEEGSPQHLRKDALGLMGAMMLGVVILSPSLAIYFNWGFMVPSVGQTTAVVFAIALAMSLPTAYSYALINSRMPSAGASYKWASHLMSPYVGIAIGLCTTLFYACLLPAELPFIGVVASDLARSTSTAAYAAIMVGALALAIPFVYRGVNFNIDASAVLVTLEVVILIVIAGGALLTTKHPHALLAPLNPADLPSTSALIPALVLGVLAFTGYDAVSTVAEETKMARQLIPRATILSLVVVGAFWLVITTVLSDALPPSAYTKVIAQGGFPLAAAANAAFGSAGRDIIDVMGLEASFGLLIAGSVGSTRILYAMGRDGVISRRFGTVHPRFRVPWTGVSAVLAFAVTADVLLALYLGIGFNITLWIANLMVFFASVTYLVINVCNPLLFARHFRSEFRWFSNGVVPAAGVAVVGYFLYKGFFEALWNAGFKMGRSVVLAALVLLGAAVLAAWAIARRRDAHEAARRLQPEPTESRAAATAEEVSP